MLQVEQIISSKAPGFLDKSPIITKPTLSLLKRLFHENEVNQFLEQNGHCIGFEFIDRVLDHFNFGYRASQVDRRNIPAVGRTLIVANHPLGALDGLAILRLIGEIRPDVKIIGVEAADAASMTESLLKNERINLDRVGFFADGAAVKLVGEETFRLSQLVADEMITDNSLFIIHD